ncbi:MAG: penicillin-binding protein [Cyclobacteriaceae bacterium]|nr:penicillin-binding protein [Cyclobacteriaceae bacterium]
MSSIKKDRNIKSKLVWAVWILFIGIFAGLPFYIYAVSNDLYGLFGKMPALSQLENPETDLSSTLYYANGEEMGKYFRSNRSQVTYDQLSDDLKKTLVASEDHRFYNHSGLDLIAYLRVVKGLLTFNLAGGGSTITQQLAKKLYSTRGEAMEGSITKLGRIPKLIVSKTKEWLIAVTLEETFTKEEIIALYLNTVDFGSNAFGIKAASVTFFGKEPSELNYQESATLIGLLQAVTRFNPILNYDNSLRKRNEVLLKLQKQNVITAVEYDSLIQLPIDLSNYKVANQNTGLANYFRAVIQNDLLKFCKERGIDLYESGLKIHTTIDKDLQQYAENAMSYWMDSLQTTFNESWGKRNPWVDENGKEIKNFIPRVIKRTEHYRKLKRKYGAESDSINIVLNLPKKMRIFSWNGEIDTIMSPMDSLRYYKKFLQAGFMAMDPHTGNIKAWVGGINYKYFKYDHVKQGKNQPGSTFKPIVYATAIENGYYPCYEVVDERRTYETGGTPPTWSPENSNMKFTGEKMTIRKGMAQSKNSVTAKIMSLVGPENVVTKAKSLGIESELAPVLSLALGVSDVSVYELIGAYSAFANQGIWTKPFYISRIEDKNGEIIQEYVPQQKQALSSEDAYLMLHMLKGTLEEEGGTARRLDYQYNLLKNGNEIGAKTGTTQNYSDGWFIGVTEDLVAGVWVGGDDRAIHFPSIKYGQGAYMALPIWADFMTNVYNDDSLGYKMQPFKKPRKRLSVTLDCGQYSLLNLSPADSLLQRRLDSLSVDLDEEGID